MKLWPENWKSRRQLALLLQPYGMHGAHLSRGPMSSMTGTPQSMVRRDRVEQCMGAQLDLLICFQSMISKSFRF